MCKVTDTVKNLTLSERASLSYIGSGPVRDRVPTSHATKLFRLGLAEVSYGRVELTPMGRRAIRVLSQSPTRH